LNIKEHTPVEERLIQINGNKNEFNYDSSNINDIKKSFNKDNDEEFKYYDNDNVQINEEDIKSQIEKNKRNIKVYSETDSMTKSIKKNRNKYLHNYSSYEQAVRMLKSINRYRVPFEKMILIATLASEITECVNEFWKDFENIVTSDLLSIDADELMTIFIYVLIKSNMPNLLIHAKFIKEFTTSNSKSTMIGYYFTTLEAAIIYILSVKDRESLDKNKDNHLINTIKPNQSSFLKYDN
jgi:hypothetical protein